MNKGALNEARFDQIEAYLLETMPQEDRDRFEQELVVDADLKREADSMRQHILAVELGGFTRTMRAVAEAGRRNDELDGGGRTIWLRYAAAVALLAAVAAWFLVDRAPAHERLFAEYHVTDPGLPVPMSSTDDAAFHDAMVAFKLGDYAEARAKWMPMLAADPTNDTLRYYLASAALAEGETAAAMPLLEQVVTTPASVFHGKARWYLFLAHLHAGDVEAMRSLDLADDPVYGDRVRAILAELGS